MEIDTEPGTSNEELDLIQRSTKKKKEDSDPSLTQSMQVHPANEGGTQAQQQRLSFKDTLLRTPAKPSWEETTEVEDSEDDMSDEEDATTETERVLVDQAKLKVDRNMKIRLRKPWRRTIIVISKTID